MKSSLTAVRQGAKVPSSDIFGLLAGKASENLVRSGKRRGERSGPSHPPNFRIHTLVHHTNHKYYQVCILCHWHPSCCPLRHFTRCSQGGDNPGCESPATAGGLIPIQHLNNGGIRQYDRLWTVWELHSIRSEESPSYISGQIMSDWLYIYICIYKCIICFCSSSRTWNAISTFRLRIDHILAIYTFVLRIREDEMHGTKPFSPCMQYGLGRQQNFTNMSKLLKKLSWHRS